MREQAPITRIMKISEVKNTFSSLVNEVARKEARILVQKAGIPVAALVSVDDLARLDQRDRAWEEGTRAMEQFGAAFVDVPPDESEKEIARIFAAGREHDKAERQSA